MSQKLGRRVVRSEPDVIYTADQNCVVKCFVPTMALDGETENPLVVIQVGAPPAVPYGDENSAPLPSNWGLEVHLEKDQQIWAVSPGESMVVFSVIPEGV
jgi:hypothetical protein